MRTWRWALAAAMAALAAFPADAPPAWAGDAALHAPPPLDDPRYVTPTTSDAIGRVVAPVYVNGQGPFRFVVDTGANRSVLSPRLAGALGLDVAGAPQSPVHGVTGVAPAPIVRVEDLRVGELSRSGVDLAVLSNRLHASADGTLGADHLRAGRLVIDFARDRIELFETSARVSPRDHRMPTRMRFGMLPVVSARIGPVAVHAVIDTGAERSVGNAALRRALLREGMALQTEGEAQIFGVVGPTEVGDLVWAPRFTFGGLRIARLPILFADTHFFRIWRLEEEPALLIGMDVLGQFDALTVDYGRQQVSVRLPQRLPAVRRMARASRL
ncbi:MAG: retroviral-like aspartic protease family protein, partial [Hyphomonadaceae bacterium]|nr:retroviral-like aspartic protease family protein [Hyphomonadaceae bacterium]